MRPLFRGKTRGNFVGRNGRGNEGREGGPGEGVSSGERVAWEEE